MDLCYLRLVQGAVLELPGLTDYAGMPLVFRGPGFLRRCVTRATYNHEYVQRYVAQRMLELEVPLGPPPAAPAVETPVVAMPSAPTPRPEIVEEAPIAEVASDLEASPAADEPAEPTSGGSSKKNKRR